MRFLCWSRESSAFDVLSKMWLILGVEVWVRRDNHGDNVACEKTTSSIINFHSCVQLGLRRDGENRAVSMIPGESQERQRAKAPQCRRFFAFSSRFGRQIPKTRMSLGVKIDDEKFSMLARPRSSRKLRHEILCFALGPNPIVFCVFLLFPRED